MSSFAIYRLPYANQCTLLVQTSSEPEQLHSLTALDGQSGFVIAPFNIGADTPLLLLHPDQTRQLSLTGGMVDVSDTDNLTVVTGHHSPTLAKQPPRNQYRESFACFHSALLEGQFEKLVLSRCLPLPNDGTSSPFELFFRACQRYPRLFIALISTPQSGTWLTATPEILLEGKAGQWRTIALAGTIKLEGEGLTGEGENARWSTKNIQEQRYVATYLAQQLKPFASSLHEEGPRTVRAANLIHLRSDFIFTLFNHARVGELLQALHPTPAVCGLPKQEAFDFIIHNEPTPRLYYSGFMGPLNPETHLYVTLRCMHICPPEYRLYAGGGILKESTEQQEWLETEAKMDTMARLTTAG